MSGASLEVVYRDGELRRRLQLLAATLGPGLLPQVLDEVGEAVVSLTMRRFEEGKGPDGDEWQPSARAAAEGGQTLVERGILRDSITYARLAGVGGVEVGTNVLYGAIHQFGGRVEAKTGKGLRFRVAGAWVRKAAVTIPARPYLGLSDDDEADLVAIVDDWMRHELAGVLS